MKKKKIGLFVMVYGILELLDDVEVYYIYICYGCKLLEEVFEDLIGCYKVIGGILLFVKIMKE